MSAFLSWSWALVANANTDRPNIILIMADDLGYECLGSNGSTSYRTPQLDALARKGVRFTHCYSQPLCTPSRVQIMTGRYNHANYQYFGYLAPQEFTFGNLAKQAGYATCIAGKWQLNGLTYKLDRHQDATRPRDAGFDAYCLWQLTQPRSKGERYAKPLIEQNGRLLDTTLDDYGPDVFTDFILDFMERNRKEPFFVYYPMVLTHDPFVPTPHSAEWSGQRNKKNNRFFGDMVHYMDHLVGRIHHKLEELQLSEKTILLFTGDNGTHRSIRSKTQTGSILGGKGTTPNAGTHVPLLAYWKGVTPEGGVCRDLVDFSDMFPTFSEAMGSVHPRPEIVEGRSFLAQLKGERGNPRSWVYCYYDPLWGRLAEYKNQFVRDRRFKLYQDGRLFDIPEDALEKRPIDPGKESPEAKTARHRLNTFLGEMPEWTPKPPNKVP
jgi:arylsulfatase A